MRALFAKQEIGFVSLFATLLFIASEPAISATSLPQIVKDSCSGDSPKYSNAARDAGDTGTVVVRLSVDASGAPEKVEVVKSSGHDRLDRSASSWIMTCRFKPWTVEGANPRSVTHDYTFSFGLRP